MIVFFEKIICVNARILLNYEYYSKNMKVYVRIPSVIKSVLYVAIIKSEILNILLIKP